MYIMKAALTLFQNHETLLVDPTTYESFSKRIDTESPKNTGAPQYILIELRYL